LWAAAIAVHAKRGEHGRRRQVGNAVATVSDRQHLLALRLMSMQAR
jgi:hypothetical protein